MYGSDYDCSNGRFVTEGDNVDDSGDECFTLMVMIITTVVLVASFSWRLSPSGNWVFWLFFLCFFTAARFSACNASPQSFGVISIAFPFEALELVLFTVGGFRVTYARGTAADGQERWVFNAFISTAVR